MAIETSTAHMTDLQPVLIAGRWQPAQAPIDTFQAVDPATGETLAEQYPVSGRDDVLAAIEAGAEAATALRALTPTNIAAFLERFADLIEEQRDALVKMAQRETGLPAEPRLNSVELPRTTNQLRQAAQAARDRSWTAPVIDTKTNIRAMRVPLSAPIVVLGPNNFPFAFNSVSGGDSAAALAAGNPVIAKANPAHPGTTRLLAELARKAIEETGLPGATLQLIYHMPNEVGLELVAHPRIGATAFTGSRGGGLKLKAAADQAGKPIYLELSSVNPVFILSGAIEERLDSLADEFFTSCTMGTRQFCTNPGLVVVPAGARGEQFVEAAAQRFGDGKPGTLFGPGVLKGVDHAVRVLAEHGAEIVVGGSTVDGPGYRFKNTLLRVDGERFLQASDALQTEAFGPASLVILARDDEQMMEIAGRLEGSLTGTIYSHTGEQDEIVYGKLAPILIQKVGRLLNDKMPTGVTVSPAMNHGGPFPATGHPGFTAVGIPAAITRFTALLSYDNVRPHRLPPELRDENPGRIWRSIDGMWTQEDVARSASGA